MRWKDDCQRRPRRCAQALASRGGSAPLNTLRGLVDAVRVREQAGDGRCAARLAGRSAAHCIRRSRCAAAASRSTTCARRWKRGRRASPRRSSPRCTCSATRRASSPSARRGRQRQQTRPRTARAGATSWRRPSRRSSSARDHQATRRAEAGRGALAGLLVSRRGSGALGSESGRSALAQICDALEAPCELVTRSLRPQYDFANHGSSVDGLPHFTQLPATDSRPERDVAQRRLGLSLDLRLRTPRCRTTLR